MSENVPFEIETGEPEDIAPMAIYLMSDAGRDVNAQIYTVVGRRISVWNQPVELRTMWAPGDRWSPAEIADLLPSTIGQEPNPFIDDLERRMGMPGTLRFGPGNALEGAREEHFNILTESIWVTANPGDLVLVAVVALPGLAASREVPEPTRAEERERHASQNEQRDRDRRRAGRVHVGRGLLGRPGVSGRATRAPASLSAGVSG